MIGYLTVYMMLEITEQQLMLYQVLILMNDVIFSMLFILCTVFVSSHQVYKNKASNT